MQYCKVEVKNSAKPCHFPYKIVRNCARANVQSPVKSVRDPALNAKLNYIIRYKQ